MDGLARAERSIAMLQRSHYRFSGLQVGQSAKVGRSAKIRRASCGYRQVIAWVECSVFMFIFRSFWEKS